MLLVKMLHAAASLASTTTALSPAIFDAASGSNTGQWCSTSRTRCLANRLGVHRVGNTH
jgi:hypothetical protein